MKKAVLSIAFLMAISCNEQHKTDATEPKGHHGQNHGDHHGSANEFMHQASFEELLERFESPERDAYQKPEKVLDYLGDVQNKTIMDIGAGSGYFSVKLVEKGAKVIAADVDENFQKYIEKRIDENGLKNIETRKIPYDSPNLNDGEADMVLVVNTYHHIENRAEYFSKVKKGTKSEGELVIIDFFKVDTPVGPPVNHKISIDQVVEELKQAGYKNFEVNVDLLPYQFIIRCK